MVKPFDPHEYKDDYEDRLRALLAERARGDAPKKPKTRAAKATSVVDLAEVLRQSLAKHPAKAPKDRPVPARAHGGIH